MFRISVVSYLNSKPFLHGLKHSHLNADISVDIPLVCSEKLLKNEADIGLVPVASLPEMKEYHIISDYCIAANGKVNSVFLFSNYQLKDIKTIYLDNHSKTSNALVQILAERLWKIEPVYGAEKVSGHLQDREAIVQIGDKTFKRKSSYLYAYDLAEEWQKLTGLPFVFAVWASNKPIPDEFVKQFNDALKVGLEQIDEVIAQSISIPKYHHFDVESYLKNDVSFHLDEQKKEALDLFLSYMPVALNEDEKG